MTAPAADGPVWRDRGAIIAQQQTRIAELEAELAALRGRIEALADELAGFRGLEGQRGIRWANRLRDALAAAPAEGTTPAAPHAEDGA